MTRLSARLAAAGCGFLLLLTAPGCSSAPPEPWPGDPPSRLETNFRDEIILEDFRTIDANGHTAVELHWRAMAKPSADYNVFVHILGKDDEILFQRDHKLRDAAGQPTSTWFRGQFAKGAFVTKPPEGIAPGRYTIRLGLMTVKPNRGVEVVRSDLERGQGGWRPHSVLLPDVECR